jgi:hypothetical protein
MGASNIRHLTIIRDELPHISYYRRIPVYHRKISKWTISEQGAGSILLFID